METPRRGTDRNTGTEGIVVVLARLSAEESRRDSEHNSSILRAEGI